MSLLRVVTADHPQTLTDWALDRLRDLDTVVVVPGLHPRRRLLNLLEQRNPEALLRLGARVLTVTDLRRHLGEMAGGREMLTSAQWDELVRAAILRAHAAGDTWATSLLDTRGRLPATVLRRVARLMAEVLQADLEPIERRDMLTAQFPDEMGPGTDRLATDLANRLIAANATTWLSARHAVAGGMANTPLATPATRWCFLGLDGALPNDGELQMALGLLEHPEVEDVVIGLWAPNDLTDCAAELPGQAPLLEALLQKTEGRREILTSRDDATWARQLTCWERPMITPPLARIEAPDLTIAVEWTMRRIKRRLLDGQPMDRVGIVAPHGSDATALAIDWANRLGVPLVASMEAPLDRAPILRVVNALLSCTLGDWTRDNLRAMAGHPAMSLPIPMAAIDRAAAVTTPPTTADGWRGRLQVVLGGHPGVTDALGILDQLAERLEDACPRTPATPGQWVARVGTLLRAFQLHRGGVTPAVAQEWTEATGTVRLNGEALNTLWRDLLAWARACELGGDASTPVSARGFLEAWQRLVTQGVVRFSNYPQRGVWLLDPTHLTAMTLDEVYLLDLVEGAWGIRRPSAGLLRDAAVRTQLRLETETEAIAREQLLFQQALAAIGQAGWLVSHSRDARGRACAPSPLLQLLALRHGTLSIERPTASSLLPRQADQVLMPTDAYWWSSRPGAEPVAGQPAVAPIEEIVPGAAAEMIHSPSDLEAYDICGHRARLTQVFGGERGSEDEQRAARRLLYALWRAAQAGGEPDSVWGESHEAAIAPVWHALHRNVEVAAELTVGLRRAVRAAWETMRAERVAMAQPDGPLRTKVLARGILLGEPRAPLQLTYEQTEWLLRTEVSSVEVIDDPRCVGPLAKLQGMLILRELTWQTDGGSRAQHNAWLEGKDLGLPLQAAVAELRYDAKVWGWQRIALLGETPTVTDFWTRHLVANNGALTIRPQPKNAPDHPVKDAMEAALRVSADRVQQMRQGNYPVKPGFHCGFCPVRRACTKSDSGGRAPKQITVPLEREARGVS